MIFRVFGLWRVLPIIGLLFPSLYLAGCGGSGHGCAAVVRYAVEASVRDAETGEPIAEGATGTLTDGDFSETMRVAGWAGGGDGRTLVLGGATERSGTYTVRIERPGYAGWEARNLRVGRGPCNVNTRQLDVRLQRLP